MAQNLPAADRPPEAGAPAARPAQGRRAAAVAVACYLLAAAAVSRHLWADPAARAVGGNPHDADQFAWFLRHTAAAVAGGRLPALVTTAMNAPQGISLMWNTSLLLPGVLLAPVTLSLGAQVSLTILTTAGFAGSAASMYAVLRRWEVSGSAAALGGAVYGFSPALLHAAIGHYNLQLAILPPLIIDAGLRLARRDAAPVRAGTRLGLLVTAQLFTGEELLLLTAIAGLILAAAIAAGAPATALRRTRTAAPGLAVAVAVTLALSGYALWAQFFGPLTQRGSAFTPDFFKNDLTGFVTPSRYLLLHTSASAAAAARYQGGAPEYLGYLGWPLIIVLAAAAVRGWRSPAVRALALTLAGLIVLSLGPHPLISGTEQPGVRLPWYWLQGVPVLGAALPDRLSIVADGAAAALLACALDSARRRWARTRPGAALITAIAVAAVLPLVPRSLPAVAVAPRPAGWSAAIAALRLPPGGRVLVVPVPTADLTAPLRWQADTGEPAELIGGYFTGPAGNGRAYIGGSGVTVTAQYLDRLWSGGPAVPVPAVPVPAAPAAAQVAADLAAWRPAAVLAVTRAGSPLARYLMRLLHQPTVRAGAVLGWRL